MFGVRRSGPRYFNVTEFVVVLRPNSRHLTKSHISGSDGTLFQRLHLVLNEPNIHLKDSGSTSKILRHVG